ncbi:hypothetical protein [Serratia fonticola]
MFDNDCKKISDMFFESVREESTYIEKDKRKQNQLKARYALINMLFEQVVKSCSRELLKISREKHYIKLCSVANEKNVSVNNFSKKEDVYIDLEISLCAIVKCKDERLSLVPSADLNSLELKFEGGFNKSDNFKITWSEEGGYWSLIVFSEVDNRIGKLDENAVRRVLHYFFFR